MVASGQSTKGSLLFNVADKPAQTGAEPTAVFVLG